MQQRLITKCVRLFITKCDSFITKCDNLLENATLNTKCVGTNTL